MITGDSRKGTFIAWISPDRARHVVTRVWPYSPEVVAAAPDGTIWTVGAVANDNYGTVHPNVLRHYTPSGELLASTIVSGVRKSNGGVYHVGGASVLMLSNDRVGWLTMACRYIEFSLDAVELGTYACPNGYTKTSDISGVALSSAGDLLVGGNGSRRLAPVSQDASHTQMLLGFDGLTLVTSSMKSSMRRYTWSAAMPR
jgi:hypothetical protein